MKTMDIFGDNKNKVIYEVYRGTLGDNSSIKKLENVELSDDLVKSIAKENGMSNPKELFRNESAQDGIEYSVFDKEHNIMKLYFRDIPKEGLKVDLIDRNTGNLVISTIFTEYLSILDLQRLLFQIDNNIKFIKFENKTENSKLIMILTAELNDKELEYQIQLEWNTIPVVIDKLDTGKVSNSSKFFRVKSRGNVDRIFLLDIGDETLKIVDKSIMNVLENLKKESNPKIKAIVRMELY